MHDFYKLLLKKHILLLEAGLRDYALDLQARLLFFNV
jgi:hypothetical protein